LAWGAALGAPPPLVWCTTTPVVVTVWRPREGSSREGTAIPCPMHHHPCGSDHLASAEQPVVALASPVAVCTTMCTMVHRLTLFGATTAFIQRLG
jgi:hypothetical protein